MLNEQDAKPTCMVSDVTKDTVQVVAVVESKPKIHFKWSLWWNRNQRYISSGRCGGIEVHGPYKTADEACKAATAKYGVTKLTSPMLIF
ncbi:hypothetical protein ACER1D_000362 [Vibrio alginolyticus]